MKPSVPSPELLRELLRERAGVQPSATDLQRICEGALARSQNLRNRNPLRRLWAALSNPADPFLTPRFVTAMAALFVIAMGLAVFSRLAIRGLHQSPAPTPPILAAQPNASLRSTTPVNFPSTPPAQNEPVQALPEPQ